MFRYFILLVSATLCLLPRSADADEGRFALLIGNKSYSPQVGVLTNPGNDVRILEKALLQVGFDVKVVDDASRAKMLSEANAYSVRLGSYGTGAVGFFYYSGHGVSRPQYNTNFLIPVDVSNTSDNDFWWNAVSVDQIVSDLKVNAPYASHFVIIDACRNELRIPFKSVSKGFTGMSDENGFFIALSTSPNTSSSDEGDGSGPYAKALSEEVVQPGLDNLRVFQNVKRKVFGATRGAQRTWESNGLLDPIIFKAAGAQVIEAPSKPPVVQSKNPEPTRTVSIEQLGLSGKVERFCPDLKLLIDLGSQGFAAIRRGAPNKDDGWKSTFTLPPFDNCRIQQMSNVTYICTQTEIKTKDRGLTELKKVSDKLAACLGKDWRRSQMESTNTFFSDGDRSVGMFVNEMPAAFSPDKKPTYYLSMHLNDSRYEERSQADTVQVLKKSDLPSDYCDSLQAVIEAAANRFENILGLQYMKGSYQSKLQLNGWNDCDISDFDSSTGVGRRWYECKALKLPSSELADEAVQTIAQDIAICLGSGWKVSKDLDYSNRPQTNFTSVSNKTTLNVRSRKSGRDWNVKVDVNMGR